MPQNEDVRLQHLDALIFSAIQKPHICLMGIATNVMNLSGLRVLAQILFYTWGFPSLERDNTLELKLAGTSDSLGASAAAMDGLASTEGTGVQPCIEHQSNSGIQNMGDAGGSRFAIDIDLGHRTSVLVPTIEKPDRPFDGHVCGNHEIDTASMPQVGISSTAAVSDARRQPNQSTQQGQMSELPTFAMESVGRDSSETVAEGRGKKDSRKNGIGETLSSTVVEDGEHNGRFREIRARAREVLLSPNIIAVFVGIVISMFPSLKEMLFENTQAALWPLGAALQVRVFWILVIYRVISLLSLSAVQDYSTRGFNYTFFEGARFCYTYPLLEET